MEGKVKYYILALLIASGVGPYFSTEMPALIYKQLLKHMKSVLEEATAEMVYGLLFTAYNLPNMILPIFCGIVSDKIGDEKIMKEWEM